MVADASGSQQARDWVEGEALEERLRRDGRGERWNVVTGDLKPDAV
ncbi:MAG: hypothetical protein M3P34_00100 [Actinomycetota bacterium]|nr:hypothetical protein [Actinomycetota bacterium]